MKRTSITVSVMGTFPARGANDTLSSEQIRAAMAKKSAEFRESGAEIYLPKPAAE